YTSAFLNIAREPNLPIEQLFKRVRLEVNNATRGRQTPWESSSLTSDFYFFGDTAVAAGREPDRRPILQMAANHLPSRSVRKLDGAPKAVPVMQFTHLAKQSPSYKQGNFGSSFAHNKSGGANGLIQHMPAHAGSKPFGNGNMGKIGGLPGRNKQGAFNGSNNG